MIIGNVTLSHKSPLKFLGGSTLSPERGNFNTSGGVRNLYSGWASIDSKSGVPNGYRHPGAWVAPQKAGGLSSFGNISGVAAVSNANLAGGRNLTASIAGVGSVTPVIVGVGNIGATIAGTGAITSANLAGALYASATIAGSGAVSAGITGKGVLSSTINGVGAVTANIVGAGNISADILVNSEVSPWDQQLDDHEATGSFGAFVQKLLTVGKFLGLK